MNDKSTQQSLTDWELGFREVVARAPAIICRLAPHGSTLFVNDAVTGVTGYQPNELLGKNWWNIFYPGEQRRQVEELYRCFRSGNVAEHEMVLTTKDGATKTLTWNSSICYLPDGFIESITFLGLAIAKRNHPEHDSKESIAKLRRALEGTIQAMAMIVETRDPYTAGHQRRVAELAGAMAEEMGLSEEQIGVIRMAGLIHDIGKIGIPAEILSKPGRISDLELNLIKAHPKMAYDILKTIEFSRPIAQIVLQHHELMDGSGYPSGLVSEDILLEARILGVADVVEAMASHRPYRPALGIEEALKEILKARGTIYDRGAVDACLKLVAEKGFGFSKEIMAKVTLPVDFS